MGVLMWLMSTVAELGVWDSRDVCDVLVVSQQDVSPSQWLHTVRHKVKKSGAKPMPAFQSGHGWGWSKTPSLSKGFIKTHITEEEAKLGLVTASGTAARGELGQGRARSPPGVFWFLFWFGVGATVKSQHSSTEECWIALSQGRIDGVASGCWGQAGTGVSLYWCNCLFFLRD